MSIDHNRNVYVGHRYVPKIYGEWNKEETYEGLSIVTFQGSSYTSKKRVPVGVDILNTEYWTVTGNYNAQVEQYRQDVRDLESRVNSELGQMNESISEIEEKKLDTISFNVFKMKIERSIDERGLNVKTLGATGGTELDNSQIIQDAIKYIADDGTLTDTLYIPKGKYKVDKELKLDGWGFNIVGDGRYSEIIAGNVNRAIISSLSEDRNKTDALRNVVIENIHLDGNGRDIYGFLGDGFNRGCQFNRNRVSNCGLAQVALNGSWCFIFKENVLEGIRGSGDSTNQHRGYGLVMGDQNIPAFYKAYTVNIPTIIGNSFQFLAQGLYWRRGHGGTIISNTFESTQSYYSRFDYPTGFVYSGNYHEVNYGRDGVIIGQTGIEGPVKGASFNNNFFERLVEGSTTHFRIVGMQNSSIKHNHFTDHTDRQFVISSDFDNNVSFGNEIQLTPGRYIENTIIDRTKNNVFRYKPGDIE